MGIDSNWKYVCFRGIKVASKSKERNLRSRKRRRRKVGTFQRWFWMLESAGVAREAPPQGTGPDAGPRIANPYADLHPRAQGGVKHALHRRRASLVPWQWRQNGRLNAMSPGWFAVMIFDEFKFKKKKKKNCKIISRVYRFIRKAVQGSR